MPMHSVVWIVSSTTMMQIVSYILVFNPLTSSFSKSCHYKQCSINPCTNVVAYQQQVYWCGYFVYVPSIFPHSCLVNCWLIVQALLLHSLRHASSKFSEQVWSSASYRWSNQVRDTMKPYLASVLWKCWYIDKVEPLFAYPKKSRLFHGWNVFEGELSTESVCGLCILHTCTSSYICSKLIGQTHPIIDCVPTHPRTIL